MSGWLIVAAVTTAFNLSCTGTVKHLGGATPEEKPFARTIVVDLDAKKWCEDDCKSVYDIQDIQPAGLMLVEDTKVTPGVGRYFQRKFVNRETGAYSATLDGYGSLTIYSGKCEKAEFTGFPEIPARF